jgi:uncharacterized DUF497 family protein
MPDVRYSLDGMGFVWASDKNAINLQKHGIRFEVAAHVYLDT